MVGRVARHLLLRLWLNAASVALAGAALMIGLELAFDLGRDENTWTGLWGKLLERLPQLPGLVVFAAVGITLARLRREGSLMAVPGWGVPLRRVGAWLLVGCLPFALAAGLAQAFPPERVPAVPDAQARISWSPVEGGGIFFRAGAPNARRTRGAVLLPDEELLLIGTANRPWPGGPAGRLQLDAREIWDLQDGAAQPLRRVDRQLWTGQGLSSPRSLIWGAESVRPNLPTLQAWLEAEPRRVDLRFARDAKLRAAPRVLVLVLIGLGFWLRPSTRPFSRRTLKACLVVGAFFYTEAWCGSLGVIGELDPTLAAFGPAALFGAIGGIGWWRADLPGN